MSTLTCVKTIEDSFLPSAVAANHSIISFVATLNNHFTVRDRGFLSWIVLFVLDIQLFLVFFCIIIQRHTAPALSFCRRSSSAFRSFRARKSPTRSYDASSAHSTPARYIIYRSLLFAFLSLSNWLFFLLFAIDIGRFWQHTWTHTVCQKVNSRKLRRTCSPVRRSAFKYDRVVGTTYRTVSGCRWRASSSTRTPSVCRGTRSASGFWSAALRRTSTCLNIYK